MAKYSPTQNQKQILILLVKGVTSGIIHEPILPERNISIDGYVVEGIEEPLGENAIDDLEALCEEGFLSSRIVSSFGDKAYNIRQSGYDAVANDFELPNAISTQQVNIENLGTLVQGGHIENLQSVGQAFQSEVKQIVSDPERLKETVDELTKQLVDAIKTEIPTEQLFEYMKTVEELKQQLVAKKTSPTVIQSLFKTLSFLGDLSGTISLATLAWPHIYPLLMIACERIQSVLP